MFEKDKAPWILTTIGIITTIIAYFFSNNIVVGGVALSLSILLLITIYIMWEKFKSDYTLCIPVIFFAIATVVLVIGTNYVVDLGNDINTLNNNISDLNKENKNLKGIIENFTKNEPYVIDIDYNGTFNAGFDSETVKKEGFTSNNHVAFTLENTSYVNVGAEKADGGSGTLTLKVMKGDKVIEEKSTSEPYGEVKINI